MSGKRLLFVDVETTGIYGAHRVVSLGAVEVEIDGRDVFVVDEEHLIFNPERKCSQKAFEAHGYADDFLAEQDLFADHAEDLERLFDGGRQVWAHHAIFDEWFVRMEFKRAGRKISRKKFRCTMELYREKGQGGSAALQAVLDRIGVVPPGGAHNALSDAWGSLAVYMHLKGFDLDAIPEISHSLLVPAGAGAVVPFTSTPRIEPPREFMVSALVGAALPIVSLAREVCGGGWDSRDADIIRSVLADVAVGKHYVATASDIRAAGERVLGPRIEFMPIAVAAEVVIHDRHFRDSVAGVLGRFLRDGDPGIGTRIAAIEGIREAIRSARGAVAA